MRKIYIVLLLLLSVKNYAQSTTQSEYLYMTKGLKLHLESGLDVKQGYEIKGFYQINQGDFTFNYLALIRKNKEQNRAGIVVIVKNNISSEVYFKSIPVVYENKKEVINVYAKLFSSDLTWSDNINKDYAIATSMALSHAVKYVDFNKK